MVAFEVVLGELFVEAAAAAFDGALWEVATVGVNECDTLTEAADAANTARGTVEETPTGTIDGS